MAKQVRWNKFLYDRFCELAMLSDFEKEVLEGRIRGMSIVEQSIKHNTSTASISRTINRLKEKYDDVQKFDGSNLPVRRVSEEEKWMDTH